MGTMSLPSRGAWIEIHQTTAGRSPCPSLPSRGAWIEIGAGNRGHLLAGVAPLTGSVD